jgi:anti-sigma-K factor RskA
MASLSHDQVRELLGAYALDAVDPDEAEAIELHLRDCPQCAAEVADHRDTAALLAHAGADAPSGVWDRIVSTLEEQPPVLELRSAPRQSWSTRLLAAAAVVVIAAGVSWVVGRNASNGRSPGRLDAAIIAAYADPHAQRVRLASSDGSQHADVVLLPDGNGYFVRSNLPALSADRTYQLWGDVKGVKVSLGVLGTAPGSLGFAARASIGALAVTVEQAGGAVTPQHAPVVTGALPA